MNQNRRAFLGTALMTPQEAPQAFADAIVDVDRY